MIFVSLCLKSLKIQNKSLRIDGDFFADLRFFVLNNLNKKI